MTTAPIAGPVTAPIPLPTATRPLSPVEAEHGCYIETAVPCYVGKAWINPALMVQLAGGQNILVIEGAVREGLVSAGWAHEVSDLYLRGTEAFAAAYLAVHRLYGPTA